jgi:DNA-binding response OmpR family regulator
MSKRILLVEDEVGLALTLEDPPDRGRLRGRGRARRRSGAAARRRRAVRPGPARRDAAEEERLRRLQGAARRAPAPAGADADRARPDRGQGRGPEARRRRLPGQAVPHVRAGGACRGAAPAQRAFGQRRRDGSSRSATSAWTSARPSHGRRQAVELSARELQLLRYFLEHKGATLTRQELLDAVWGWNVTSSTRTVDVHVAGLRKKLERDRASHATS